MGLEIDLLWLTILMFGSLAVLLMSGLPPASARSAPSSSPPPTAA